MGLSIKNGCLEVLKSIVCVVFYMFMKSPFDNRYCITKEYGEKSLLYKVTKFEKINLKKFSLFISIFPCLCIGLNTIYLGN